MASIQKFERAGGAVYRVSWRVGSGSERRSVTKTFASAEKARAHRDMIERTVGVRLNGIYKRRAEAEGPLVGYMGDEPPFSSQEEPMITTDAPLIGNGHQRRQHRPQIGYTIPQFANNFGVPENRVRRAAHRGDIKTVKFNGFKRIPPEEAERICDLFDLKGPGVEVLREWRRQWEESERKRSPIKQTETPTSASEQPPALMDDERSSAGLDIVERLRRSAPSLHAEAASEIERLRKIIEQIRRSVEEP